MNTYDIKRLALVNAIIAEIEGMKFDNLQREQYNKSHAYTDKDFSDKAEELRVLAYKHDEQL